jgi:6-pyruvoyltetrahydropterin/6-carboxytetrahydropterin synthase
MRNARESAMSGHYSIRCRREISAAHRLPGHPGPCAAMHGHNFRVTAELGARRLEDGMVADFARVGAAMDAVLGCLDHACLNDLPELVPPTAEILAAWIFARLTEALADDRVRLTRVTVEESPGLSASYTEEA